MATNRRRSRLYMIWVRRNFVLGSALLVFLIGCLILAFQSVRYSAAAVMGYEPAELETHSPEQIKDKILTIIRSDEFLLPLIDKNQWNRRAAFNPALHPDITVYSRILEKIEHDRSPGIPLNEQIAEKIRKDLKITILKDNSVAFSFTSTSPDLAPKVANAVMNKIIAENALQGRKKMLLKASDPESFSEPDIPHALSISGLSGLILGICFAYLLACIQIRKQEAAHVR
ncbi:MAG: hypothetical protein KDI61_01590 [Alphaproteobacteria bacterium]|nr:hypothetical protein [Alphaproteobacteria bacterium]